MKFNLSKYSLDELRDLNHQICETIKTKEKEVAYSFRYGDRVEWNGKLGHRFGSVIKVNRQTVQVKDDLTGTIWRVTASLLKKV